MAIFAAIRFRGSGIEELMGFRLEEVELYPLVSRSC